MDIRYANLLKAAYYVAFSTSKLSEFEHTDEIDH